MLRKPLLLGILGSVVVAATLLSQQPAPPINVYDGFEGPSLSNLWNTISIAPNSAWIQSSIVRAGHGALRIDLHSRDTFMTGRDGDADSERDELLGARPLTTRQNKLYDISWSMYLPLDFPIVPVRLVVAQWWEYCPRTDLPCSNDSPVLAVRYIGGVLSITQDLNHQYIVLYQEKRDLRGRWLDLRFEVRSAHVQTAKSAHGCRINRSSITTASLRILRTPRPVIPIPATFHSRWVSTET
jgi:Polysaccharide lyase